MNQEHHPRPVFWKKRTVADAVDALVTEDGVLTEVSKSTGLLKEGGGKTVSVGLVVDARWPCHPQSPRARRSREELGEVSPPLQTGRRGSLPADQYVQKWQASHQDPS